MKKLIENDLLNGYLLEINEKFLVERYNRALEIITGLTTNLNKFNIDSTGFSPEIAEELKDEHYLDKNGVNLNIIILTTEQQHLPVINTTFSNHKLLIKSFIQDNYKEILSLTSKDVLYGYIENDILKLNNISDLIPLRTIKFNLETSKNLIKKTIEFEKMIKKFKEGDNWYDDEIINQILEYSVQIGDIEKTPFIPKKLEYPIDNFYTSHHGGYYFFRHDENNLTIIPKDTDTNNFSKYKKEYGIQVEKVSFIESSIIDFLTNRRLIEIFNQDYYEENFYIITNKMIFFVFEHVLKNKNAKDISVYLEDEQEYKRYVTKYYDEFPREWKDLEYIYKTIKDRRYVHIEKLSIKTKILLAIPKTKDIILNHLIRHLLTNFDKYDFIRLYAFNKELFFKEYKKMSKKKQDYIITILKNEYVPNRKVIKDRI